MAPLPEVRLALEEYPFYHTGVDLSGGLLIRKDLESNDTEKCYLVLFTCMSTRAVHLDLVRKTNTQEFLMCFKRFINTRGMPRTVSSDNAGNFTKGSQEILETIEKTNSKIKDDKLKYQFQWIFHAPEAPHTSGTWERLMKVAKDPIRKMAKDRLLTYDELLTVFKEVEGTLNDRPIISADETSLETITPSMLMLGHKLKPWVDKFSEVEVKSSGKKKEEDVNIRERWKLRNQVLARYKTHFQQAYLTELQKRGKWHTPKRNLREGDLVLIEHPTKKRGAWETARVIKTKPGRDHRIRTVFLSKGPFLDDEGNVVGMSKTTARNVNSLFPLELNAERKSEGEEEEESDRIVPPVDPVSDGTH